MRLQPAIDLLRPDNCIVGTSQPMGARKSDSPSESGNAPFHVSTDGLHGKFSLLFPFCATPNVDFCHAETRMRSNDYGVPINIGRQMAISGPLLNGNQLESGGITYGSEQDAEH